MAGFNTLPLKEYPHTCFRYRVKMTILTVYCYASKFSMLQADSYLRETMCNLSKLHHLMSYVARTLIYDDIFFNSYLLVRKWTENLLNNIQLACFDHHETSPMFK